MKLGVTFPQTEIESDPTAIGDFAQACEEIGFSFLVIYDHVLGADPGRPGGWQGLYDKDDRFHEPFVTFGFLAALTRQIELWTSILVLPQRQTVLVAKQAAQVDLLSGGRLQLGVGVGWNPIEFEGLGCAFADRGRRIEEQVELLRQLWENEAVSFEGKWHRVSAAGINPRPPRRIPIWIGGGADAVVRRAARLGDGWMPGGSIHGPQQALPKAALLRRELEALGRDPAGFPILGGLLASLEPESWGSVAALWRQVGATHVCFHTMGAGYERLEQHVEAARRFYATMRESG